MRLPRTATYLHPNRNTFGLVAVLMAMWYAGSSQNNGAAYLLCFLIGSVALVSAVHTWANLKGLACNVGAIAPVYAGGSQIIPVLVQSLNGRTHYALTVATGRSREIRLPLLGSPQVARVELAAVAATRGRFEEVHFVVRTIYPLGFFTARRKFVLPRTHYVYPAPEGDRPFPESNQQRYENAEGRRNKGDDFAGVKGWSPGESMRHIDWKAAARSDNLLVKQWSGSAGRELWLEWEALHGMESEARLRQLARWLLLAEAQGLKYGLAIPGSKLEPGRGDGHLHQCLRALAVFDQEKKPTAPLPSE